MGEADIAGVTRDGRRWELAFQGESKEQLVTVERLEDVIRLLQAHIEILKPNKCMPAQLERLRNGNFKD